MYYTILFLKKHFIYSQMRRFKDRLVGYILFDCYYYKYTFVFVCVCETTVIFVTR